MNKLDMNGLEMNGLEMAGEDPPLGEHISELPSFLDRRASPKLPHGAVFFGLPEGADARPDPPANGRSMVIKKPWANGK